jgi:hypothetical protein
VSDAFVVHFLAVGLALFAAFRASMKELDDGRNRHMLLDRVDPGRRSDVNESIGIKINHVVVQGADIGSARRLIAPAHVPVATVAQFFHRGAGRGKQFRAGYQKLYDDRIQVALKYLGE